jgi:excisionase family DNA binding protein
METKPGRARAATRRKRELVAAKRQGADVLTVDDVATRLGIGRNQAYAAIQLGHIPALRFGRRWLVPRAAFERMLNSEAAARVTA